MFTPPKRQEIIKRIPSLDIDWPVAYQIVGEGRILERGFSFIKEDTTFVPQLTKNESNGDPWAFSITRRLIEDKFIGYLLAPLAEGETTSQFDDFIGWIHLQSIYEWDVLYNDAVQKVWRVTPAIVDVGANLLIEPGKIEQLDGLGEIIGSSNSIDNAFAFSTEGAWSCSVFQQGVFTIQLANSQQDVEVVYARPIFLTKNLVIVTAEPSRQRRQITLTFKGGRLFDRFNMLSEQELIWYVLDSSIPLAERMRPPAEVLTADQISQLPKEQEFSRHSSTSSQIPPAAVDIDRARLISSPTETPNSSPAVTAFAEPKLQWTIRHTQNRYPQPLLLDKNKSVIKQERIVDIAYPNRNTIVVTFTSPQDGIACI